MMKGNKVLQVVDFVSKIDETCIRIHLRTKHFFGVIPGPPQNGKGWKWEYEVGKERGEGKAGRQAVHPVSKHFPGLWNHQCKT